MPRQSRIDIPGALHHIMCRGIEHQTIFVDDLDRNDFLNRLDHILNDSLTRCFAWALLPNHFHLLLQTGPTPISVVMHRLLTGYAVSFNHRHQRHGHLFQNRYKSILCQQEPYLLELVRYIHLNPLRAGIVSSLTELEHYAYCGHGQILGHNQQAWLAADEILQRFGKRVSTARSAYCIFLAEGAAQGKRPDLTGGGLVRSYGGWQRISSTRQAGYILKSDERLLGDSVFVSTVLETAGEKLSQARQHVRQQIDFDTLAQIVADMLQIKVHEVLTRGKQPRRVQARSLLCFWATRELGLTATALAVTLRLTQPAISLAVRRGEQLAQARGWQLEDLLARNL